MFRASCFPLVHSVSLSQNRMSGKGYWTVDAIRNLQGVSYEGCGAVAPLKRSGLAMLFGKALAGRRFVRQKPF